MLSTKEKLAEEILCPHIVALCGFFQQADRLVLIADACLPGKMHFCKRVLGIAVSLCGCFFKQCFCLRQILLDQFSFEIDLAQKILCAVVVLLLGLPCTQQTIVYILLHLCPSQIQLSESVLRILIALVCRKLQPANCLHRIIDRTVLVQVQFCLAILKQRIIRIVPLFLPGVLLRSFFLRRRLRCIFLWIREAVLEGDAVIQNVQGLLNDCIFDRLEFLVL